MTTDHWTADEALATNGHALLADDVCHTVCGIDVSEEFWGFGGEVTCLTCADVWTPPDPEPIVEPDRWDKFMAAWRLS